MNLEDGPEEIAVPNLIKNPSILAEEFIPSIVKDRDNKIRAVNNLLHEALREEGYSSNGIIYGPSGVGKTLVTKIALKNFIIESENAGKHYHYVIIDCLEKPRTLTNQYRKILHGIDHGYSENKVERTSIECQQKIISVLQEKGRDLLIVLENVDTLNQQLIYDLIISLKQKLLPININVGFIGLSRNPIPTITDQSSQSIIEFNQTEFLGYTSSELETILLNRLSAFQKGSIEEDTIQAVAKYTAREAGDARCAIALLRRSVELAQSLKKASVSTDDVSTIYEEDKRAHSTPIHKKITKSEIPVFLTMIIARERFKKSEFRSGPLYSYYCQICSENNLLPVKLPRFSAIVSHLGKINCVFVRNDLMLKKGNSRLIRIILDNENVLQFLNDIKKTYIFDRIFISDLIDEISSENT